MSRKFSELLLSEQEAAELQKLFSFLRHGVTVDVRQVVYGLQEGEKRSRRLATADFLPLLNIQASRCDAIVRQTLCRP